MSWYGDLLKKALANPVVKVLGRAVGPVMMAAEIYSGSIQEEWNNGNKLSAGLKATGLALGAGAIVVGLVASAPVAAALGLSAATVATVGAVATGLGYAALATAIIPEVVDGVKAGIKQANGETSDQTPAPENDKTSVLDSKRQPAAPQTTYAAVDTSKFTAADTPVAKEAVVEKTATEKPAVSNTAALATTPVRTNIATV